VRLVGSKHAAKSMQVPTQLYKQSKSFTKIHRIHIYSQHHALNMKGEWRHDARYSSGIHQKNACSHTQARSHEESCLCSTSACALVFPQFNKVRSGANYPGDCAVPGNQIPFATQWYTNEIERRVDHCH